MVNGRSGRWQNWTGQRTPGPSKGPVPRVRPHSVYHGVKDISAILQKGWSVQKPSANFAGSSVFLLRHLLGIGADADAKLIVRSGAERHLRSFEADDLLV